jgi:hypothetical protein
MSDSVVILRAYYVSLNKNYHWKRERRSLREKLLHRNMWRSISRCITDELIQEAIDEMDVQRALELDDLKLAGVEEK